MTAKKQSNIEIINARAKAFFNLEEDLKDATIASVILTETLMSTLITGAEKDQAGFHVFRLNDEQIKSIHYLSWQVRRHLQDAMAVYDGAEEPGESTTARTPPTGVLDGFERKGVGSAPRATAGN